MLYSITLRIYEEGVEYNYNVKSFNGVMTWRIMWKCFASGACDEGKVYNFVKCLSATIHVVQNFKLWCIYRHKFLIIYYFLGIV